MMYSEQEARERIIEACRRLVKQKLAARTWGNVSARITANQFLITPSGRAYETLKSEDLVKVQTADTDVWSGPYKPSSEKGVHAAVYRLHPDVGFVIHTHQFYASAIAAAGKDTAFAPCAAYGLPGTKTLRTAVERSLEANVGKNAFLMARHGALCFGHDLERAFRAAEDLESSCEALFRLRVFAAEQAQPSMLGGAADGPVMLSVCDPYILECAKGNRALLPYLDDFAQMIGLRARIADDSPAAIARALHGRNAVLVRGRGALCTGENADEAVAAAMIVSKNCAAALYAQKSGPLSAADCALQRVVYLKKYSRQKDA